MVNIAVMGFGTVGSGVVEVLTENAASIARKAANEICVKYILDMREFPDSPFADRIIHDFAVIEQDGDVPVVVETMGGTGAAYDFTKRCLLAGKNVITSNKELVAAHGHELLALAKEKNVNYLFEASVGGGIPIIRPITQCLAANEIDEIYGILNGTTNYILTQMIECGVSFESALADAQARGFAERDPSADIDGFDACRKICILSDLCFGSHVAPEGVSTEGIRGISLTDVACADRCGYKIKLLGRALRREDGRIHAYVAPHLISGESLLSGVRGVMNGIVIHGNAIGEAMFYGAGAGKRPTASAVAADVIDAVKHLAARKYLGWDAPVADFVAPTEELCSRWYVRAAASQETVSAVFGAVEFIEGCEKGECAFLTGVLSGAEAMEKAEKAGRLSVCRILD